MARLIPELRDGLNLRNKGWLPKFWTSAFPLVQLCRPLCDYSAPGIVLKIQTIRVRPKALVGAFLRNFPEQVLYFVVHHRARFVGGSVKKGLLRITQGLSILV